MHAQDGGARAVPSWYGGVQGGVPFGVSMFSSFGAGNTRAGYAVGVYGGHRFNPVLSLEAQAAWGKVNQGAQSCCDGYWLGADGLRYEVPVAGMAGWSYADLRSSTFVQRYGVQLNVNVLGFFAKTKYGRWTLELSPHVAAVGTQSDIQAVSGGNVMDGDTRWHFGVGGNLQAGYQVARHINIGIYSGITYLTGSPMDGMPEYRHKANYIWESGIRLGFTLFKQTSRRRTSALVTIRQATSRQGDLSESAAITPSVPGSPSSPGTPSALSTPIDKSPNATSRVTIQSSPPPRGSCGGLLPLVSRVGLLPQSRGWLVAQGIARERITAVGKGSDATAANANEARRVDTEETK